MLIVGLTILAMLALGATQITEAGSQKDALVNLRLAHNLAGHGVLSTAERAPFSASNAREPVPNLVTAGHLKLMAITGQVPSYRELVEGPGARAVKVANLYWALLGLVATALLCQALTGRLLLVVIATVLVGYFFFAVPIFVDTLYTELQASVMLLWSSLFLLLAVRTSRCRWYLAAGLCFGLLSLTKAIFFYVCLLVIIGLLLQALWAAARGPRRRPLAAGAALLLGFIAAVLPWMIRNQVQLGTFQLTQRGGRVLYARAIKNGMTASEVQGALHFWGPSFYQHGSRLLGFAATPADFQAGGRYQRINRYGSDFQQADLRAAMAGRPQDVISYHRRVGAEVNRLIFVAAAQGVPDANRKAEKQVGEQAKRMILADPGRHLMMTPLFLWRGLWSWPNEGVNFKASSLYVVAKDLLALLSYGALVVVFLLGVIRRNGAFLAVTVLPVGMLLAYGLLSHNIPRYSAPAIPLMILSLVMLVGRPSPEVAGPHERTGPESGAGM
ncbi:hypothetical protein VB738_10025 [Cyanobium gracile UHCC 0139]|uniref:Glycosyltransferase RgtA/B/C/D-like domain-containing protein n=1 Tax=Cyanobium gracile UHCC 0139 TaxID=3110308 RepID=A0ABU5RUZ0_9CYAN|nr:hypothetical protein [Cyanobium gracile]MEA5391592.1 hypothetical protein [Cyanobium gracile UHCC 0139]